VDIAAKCRLRSSTVIVLQPNSDLGVEHAWESTQSFMAVSGTRGPAYSESGSCHSGTLGEIEKFKMDGDKNITDNKLADVTSLHPLLHCQPKPLL